MILCTYTHMHTYVHTYIYTHVHMNIYTCVCICVHVCIGLAGGAVVKHPPAGSNSGAGRSAGGENGKHSSILAWKIPWTEEPRGLQSMGLQRAGHG